MDLAVPVAPIQNAVADRQIEICPVFTKTTVKQRVVATAIKKAALLTSFENMLTKSL